MSDLRKAAEMALEALEWNYGTDLENIENCTAWLDKMNATIPALRQALSEQEPEAWLVLSKDNSSVSLYAPKREWVGLTVQEILEMLPSSEWKADVTLIFAKAIEAKLKEKNGG